MERKASKLSFEGLAKGLIEKAVKEYELTDVSDWSLSALCTIDKKRFAEEYLAKTHADPKHAMYFVTIKDKYEKVFHAAIVVAKNKRHAMELAGIEIENIASLAQTTYWSAEKI